MYDEYDVGVWVIIQSDERKIQLNPSNMVNPSGLRWYNIHWCDEGGELNRSIHEADLVYTQLCVKLPALESSFDLNHQLRTFTWTST